MSDDLLDDLPDDPPADRPRLMLAALIPAIDAVLAVNKETSAGLLYVTIVADPANGQVQLSTSADYDMAIALLREIAAAQPTRVSEAVQ